MTAHRELLQGQLAIAWGYATAHVLPGIDLDLALWRPDSRSLTVHPEQGGWRADWPVDETVPATVSIGWLLWHLEWWWSDTLETVAGEPPVDPTRQRWGGDTTRLAQLEKQWNRVLAEDDLERLVDWVFPEPQPLWRVAAWVNFELTKNLAEIGQLRRLRQSSPRAGLSAG